MPLLDNFDLIFLQCQLEKCDNIVAHELGGYCPAPHIGKFFGHKTNVLLGLHDANFISAAFGLHRYDIVAAALI